MPQLITAYAVTAQIVQSPVPVVGPYTGMYRTKTRTRTRTAVAVVSRHRLNVGMAKRILLLREERKERERTAQ